nr:endo-1,4-beta-xylanase [uncultured bacterium]
MNRFTGCLILLASLLCWSACAPEDPVVEGDDDKEVVRPPWLDEDEKDDDDSDPAPVPGPYDYLDDYDVLKSYVNRAVSPDFKLGAAVNAETFIRQSDEYDIVSANFDEVTAGNAMKQASVMRPDGSMDFTVVKNFIDRAEKAGMTVYGHTLAWHSQQQNAYLNNLIKGKRVEIPSADGEDLLLEADFNDGDSPFIGWGNSHTRTVVDGVLKISNPSKVQNWEAQMAKDFSPAFTVGQKYKLKFRIRGSANGTLSSGFQITDGYKSAGEFPNVSFTKEWKEVELECECTAEGGTRLIFSFGAFAGDIYMDDFSFIATGVSYKYEQMTAAEKKEALAGALDMWIEGMMKTTAGKVVAWDAVNESVSGRDTNGDGFYELESASWGSANNFYWQDYLGSEDYVRIVVEKARKYFAEYGGNSSDLKLFINDYNLESWWDGNKKLKSLIHWINVWESDGVTKVDGIGTQMHVSYILNERDQKAQEDAIVNMFTLLASTGKLVKVTELDMGIVQNAFGEGIATSAVTDAQHRKMAEFYKFIVSKYFEIIPPAQQYGICQWCPFDAPGALGTGWRGGEPVGLWDLNYNRKHTYAGFADGLMGD